MFGFLWEYSMSREKLDQLQKMYEDGLITENELKEKREKIISEIIDTESSASSSKTERTLNNKKTTKKHKFLKILLIIIAILLGLGILGAVFDNEDKTNATEKDKSQIESDKENKKIKKETLNSRDTSLNKVGKWYSIDNEYEIKITSIEKDNYLHSGDYLMKPDEGNIYISIYFSYRNISDIPKYHSSISLDIYEKCYLESPNGKKYKPDIFASSVLYYKTLSFAEKIEYELGNFNKGYLEPYSKNLETGKDGHAVEIPKSSLQEKGWKLIIGDLEFAVSF